MTIIESIRRALAAEAEEGATFDGPELLSFPVL